ncbi:hypothetical protein D9M72_449920 [compost metagenome]
MRALEVFGVHKQQQRLHEGSIVSIHASGTSDDVPVLFVEPNSAILQIHVYRCFQEIDPPADIDRFGAVKFDRSLKSIDHVRAEASRRLD